MNTTTVTIDNKQFTIDLDKAKELGLLISKPRFIRYSDLKNGDIVRWRYRCDPTTWQGRMFIITSHETAHVVQITDSVLASITTYFIDQIYFAVLQTNGTWKTEL